MVKTVADKTPPEIEFAQELVNVCRHLIECSSSLSLLSMPGVGVSFFIRRLANEDIGRVIFMNSYELYQMNMTEVYRLLATGLGIEQRGRVVAEDVIKKLEEICRTEERVVIVFNRFDHLKKLYSHTFFDLLRRIRDVDRNKVVMIFASTRPVYELAMPYLADSYSLFTKLVYLPPYSHRDMEYLAGLDQSYRLVDAEVRVEAERLSGGHHALWQTLLRCQNLDNPIGDPMVRALMERIVSGVGVSHKRMLKRMMRNVEGSEDEVVVGLGLLRREKNEWVPFTPLLTDFLRQDQPKTLPVKEKRLLTLLKRNLNEVVNKEEIVEFVWRGELPGVSDWALNALVYRLRRHPGFSDLGYEIQSIKKQGYRLVGE